MSAVFNQFLISKGIMMKKFVFRYSPLTWVLLIVVAAIFAASVAVNVFDVIKFSGENSPKTAFAAIVATLSLAVFILTVAVASYGRYVIKGKYLYCRFGFFYSKIDINDIFQLTEFKAQNKLVMYLKGEKYTVAVISEKYYGNFYEALREINPNIAYTVQSANE